MSMDPTLVTVAVAAFAGAIVSIINAVTAASERKATAEERRTAATERRLLLEQTQAQAHNVAVVKEMSTTNTATILAVAKDTEAIKGHVNSEKTASDGRIATLNAENALLREMVTEKRATAQLLAQAAAVASAGITVGANAAPAAAATPSTTDETLAHIEVNTAETVAALKKD